MEWAKSGLIIVLDGKADLCQIKKAIIIGSCTGKNKETMGYTTEGMSKPISELDVQIIDVIEYYNTKNLPVVRDDKIRENILQRIIYYKDI